MFSSLSMFIKVHLKYAFYDEYHYMVTVLGRLSSHGDYILLASSSKTS